MTNQVEKLDQVEQQIAVCEKNNRSLLTQAGVAAGTMALATGAFAADQATDFTPIVTLINGMVATVASIGMAVLTVYATAKVFKWVKTAF